MRNIGYKSLYDTDIEHVNIMQRLWFPNSDEILVYISYKRKHVDLLKVVDLLSEYIGLYTITDQ